jgi:hypothetical protein
VPCGRSSYQAKRAAQQVLTLGVVRRPTGNRKAAREKHGRERETAYLRWKARVRDSEGGEAQAAAPERAEG